LSSQRLKLGTYFGIGLYVHWTFTLLIAYVVYSTWASGAAPTMIAFSVAQLLTVFACVTLHEYGHALSARRYDVGTLDITLLPIGGVARLKRIPQIPWQEFIIAVAGPAVNVVIASLLVLLIIASGGGWIFSAIYELFFGATTPESRVATGELLGSVLDGPSALGFALSILVINVLLVLFNMIPAFPMDGGRVLRSVLAMLMPYVQATRWAQRIGLLCAILMAAFALSSEPPRVVMVLIAGFIVYAGFAEARQVEVRELVDGLSVGDVMSTAAPVVRADMTIDQLQSWWKSNSTESAAIVGMGGVVLGHLRLSDLVGYMQTGSISAEQKSRRQRFFSRRSDPYEPAPIDEMPWETTAMDLADRRAEPLDIDQGLEALFNGGRQQQRQFAVIDESGRLVGWLDLGTLRERAAMARMQLATIATDSSGEPIWSVDQRV
jgi:Zn-dependent protease